jgi:hypothetical protein
MIPTILKIVRWVLYWAAVILVFFFLVGVAQRYDNTPLRNALLFIGLALLWGGSIVYFLRSTSILGERKVIPAILKTIPKILYWALYCTAMALNLFLLLITAIRGYNEVMSGGGSLQGIVLLVILALVTAGSVMVYFRYTSVLGKCAALGLSLLPMLAAVAGVFGGLPNMGTRV